MNETYLKPCPFCGKKPYSRILVLRGRVNDLIAIEIGCRSCEIKQSTEVQSGESMDKFEEAKKEVNNKWNGRV